MSEKQNLKNLHKIKKGLEYGDIKRISEALNLTTVYIKYVLAGKRENERVIEAAEAMCAANESIRRSRINQMLKAKQAASNNTTK